MLCSFRHGWIQESSNIIMNLSFHLSVSPSFSGKLFLGSIACKLWVIFQQPLQEDGTSFPIIAENVPKLVLVSLLGKQGRATLSHMRTWLKWEEEDPQENSQDSVTRDGG